MMRSKHNKGAKSHPLYWTWCSMRKRCTVPSRHEYKYYGARGIGYCKQWDNFWTFVSDMGPRPSARHSIDRIDNAKGYEPGNCRWATPTEQTLNSRSPRYITFLGERLCVSQWAVRFGVTPSALQHRIRKYGVRRAIEMGPGRAIRLQKPQLTGERP